MEVEAMARAQELMKKVEESGMLEKVSVTASERTLCIDVTPDAGL